MLCSIPVTTTTITGRASESGRDTSLDALRAALLQALMDQGLVNEQQIHEMLAENEGKFQGSLLEELLNQLIERLVEEGYLTLQEAPQQQREQQPGPGGGEGAISDPLPRNVRFEVTEKGLDFLGYKTLRNLLGSFGKSAAGRHETEYLSTGVEAAAASKTLRVWRHDQSRRQHHASIRDSARGFEGPAQSRIQGPARSSVRLSIVVRYCGYARLFALDDSVRRRSIHAGEEGGAGHVAPDSHPVSRRFVEGCAVSTTPRKSCRSESSRRRKLVRITRTLLKVCGCRDDCCRPNAKR